MVDGMLYAPNGVGLLEAFDAATGETRWEQEPFHAVDGGDPRQSTRGANFWARRRRGAADPRPRRVPLRREREDRQVFRDFGDLGRVSLHRDHAAGRRSSPGPRPIVVNDVIVVAGATGGAGDGGFMKEAAPEDIRGYDVRTGKLLWTFHVVPRPGEPGDETLGRAIRKATRQPGVVVLDHRGRRARLRLPAADGADRVVLRRLAARRQPLLRTRSSRSTRRPAGWCGTSRWCTTTSGSTTPSARRCSATSPSTAGASRRSCRRARPAFLYVFDRATGKPVWPIEERPVPQSTVPGEETSPTQPFPTKPPPFDRQGLTDDDLIDFTPELRARGARDRQGLRASDRFSHRGSVRSDEPGGKKGHDRACPAGGAPPTGTTARSIRRPGVYYARLAHARRTIGQADPRPRTRRRRCDYGIAGARPAAARAAATPILAGPGPVDRRLADHQAALRPDHRLRHEQGRAAVDGRQRRWSAQPSAAEGSEAAAARRRRAGRRRC